ncbi:MAG: NADH:flavin oxidoreductase, partial [Polyangiaceae bacterium]
MKSLFEPLTFRTGLTSKNRVVLAPMTNKQSHDDGSLGEEELRWLVSRAAGGFGVVMTCAAHVAKDGQGWAGELGVFDDSLLPGLTRLATELHEKGAVAILQIFHGGMRADRAASGIEPWSAVASDGVRAATEHDIARVIAEFGAAAKRAEKAGFDGIEIHGAHGYLITNFLSPHTNKRTDRYGGPLENRMRF